MHSFESEIDSQACNVSYVFFPRLIPYCLFAGGGFLFSERRREGGWRGRYRRCQVKATLDTTLDTVVTLDTALDTVVTLDTILDTVVTLDTTLDTVVTLDTTLDTAIMLHCLLSTDPPPPCREGRSFPDPGSLGEYSETREERQGRRQGRN